MAITLGVVQTKGGTCKTTTVYALAGYLADLNQRVLVLDCDPQTSLTNAFPVSVPAEDGLSRALFKGSLTGCIAHTVHPGIDIVGNDDLNGEA